MNNQIAINVSGAHGLVPYTYKTVVLKPNVVDGKNILTQLMMGQTNTKYVIKYDYVIDPDVKTGVASVSESNISHCVNPDYAAALAAYNEAHDAWIDADNAYTNDPNDTTLAAKNTAYAAYTGAQTTLNNTPQYYYYAANAIIVKQGQHINIPNGCVLLNDSLSGITDFVVAPADTTVYIGSLTAGEYNYTVQNAIVIPSGCLIEFDGGSISDGVLVGDETILIFDQKEEVVLKNVELLGTFEYSAGGSGGGIPDKEYDPEHFSGLGRKTLQLKKDGSNILTQEDFDQENTIYVIANDFDLDGKEITVPENCILEFDGGTISNGTLIGTNTTIVSHIPIDEVMLVEKQGTFNYSTAVADEEDITSEGGKLKFKDKGPDGNGKGHIILRKGKPLSEQIIYPDTTYIIKYDFDLEGETLRIRAFSTLKFEGGKFVNGIINNTEGPITIDGYGCKVTFQSSSNVTFVTPYHVSTIHGQKDKSQANGSPDRPFYYIQDALDICNNIVLERNSIFWIDQAIHNSNNNYYMAKLVYDGTTIGTYGSGRPPVFTGLCILYDQFITEIEPVDGVTLYRHDFTNAKLGSDNVKYTVTYDNIDIAYYPELINFGILTDVSNVMSKSKVLSTAPQESAINLFKNFGVRTSYWPTTNNPSIPSENDFLTLISIDYERTYHNSLSAGVGGIDCNQCSISISDCIFEYVGKHAICRAGGRTTVDNCLFRYIGGSVQTEDTSYWVRYGNAVETYGPRADSSFTVKNCSFDTVFDAAITIQGVGYPARCNHYIYGNNISNARYALEFFGKKLPEEETQNGSKLYATVFNNTIKGSDNSEHYLWYQYTAIDASAEIAEDWTAAIMTQSWELPNLKIYDNIIIDSILWFNTKANQIKPAVFVHNEIFVKNKSIVIHIKDDANNIYDKKYADISKPNEIIDFLESVHDGGRDVSHSNIIRISNKANTRGTFSQKPNDDDISIGHKYFCTDRQTAEGATDGIEIIYKGNNVWVDALGRVVS